MFSVVGHRNEKTQYVVSKLTDTTPGSGLKIMLDNIIYRTINDKNEKEFTNSR